jgi:hypothetical protein
MSQAGNSNTMNLSRRAALARLSVAAGAVALPAAASALGGTHHGATAADPIFAAIEEYKIAVAERSTALSATWDGDNPALAGLPKNAPACIAAEAAHDEAFDREWDAFDALFTTTPTTVAGVAALLEQLVVDPYASKDLVEPGGPKVELVLEWALGGEDGREDVINLMTTLASVLRALAPATRPDGEAQS